MSLMIIFGRLAYADGLRKPFVHEPARLVDIMIYWSFVDSILVERFAALAHIWMTNCLNS